MNHEHSRLNGHWFNGQPPIRNSYVTCRRQCYCWFDLWRLARWHFARWLDGYVDLCWVDLAHWAGDEERWFPEWPSKHCGDQCREEGKCGSCWCGKFYNQEAK